MAEDAKKAGKSVDVREVQKSKGLYKVEFLEAMGDNDKGAEVEMHLSTAKALEAHGKVKIGNKVTQKKAVKEE